jgi:hypothetical protein
MSFVGAIRRIALSLATWRNSGKRATRRVAPT